MKESLNLKKKGGKEVQTYVQAFGQRQRSKRKHNELFLPTFSFWTGKKLSGISAGEKEEEFFFSYSIEKRGMGSGGVEVEERWCKGWTKRGRDGWGKIGVGCVEKKEEV